jgi:hypothetical protein
MDQFFELLKQELVEIEKQEQHFDACGYYETILQHKDKLEPILIDCNKYEFGFHYQTDPEGYTSGSLMIYFYNEYDNPNINHHYVIKFCDDPRHWGYCQCTPEDPGYNPRYDCCGMGCDWTAPRIEINKIEYITSFAFNGHQKDIWELRDKWNGVTEEVHKKQIQSEINQLNKQIQQIEERKKLLEQLLK